MRSRTPLFVLVAVLLALAPVGAAAATQNASPSNASTPSGSAGLQSVRGPTAAAANASPPVGHAGPARNSTIGYFGGYWYDTPISIDQSNGLNASEARAYVRRTMARDEMIRHHNYEHAVPVDVISRANYTKDRAKGSTNATYARWNQQVWEAGLLVGSNTNLSASMNSYYSNNVQGFYSPRGNDIKIIVPSGKHAYIAHGTLAHELTHALQDQYYNLSAPKYSDLPTQDAQLGSKGLVEGEANYVEETYKRKCQRGAWQCVPKTTTGGTGGSSGSGGSSGANRPASLGLTLYFPYAAGPGYVHDLVQSGGWSAVNAAWRDPPNATSTIIHDSPPARKPVHLDRGAATNGWRTYSGQGVNGTDTLGEASIFVGLYWQSVHYGANVVSRSALRGNGNYRQYRFDAPPSAGWAGDKVLPYRKGDANGFVWKSAWNTSTDATQFADAYVTALKAHGASSKNGVWVVSKRDGYQGAYRVALSDDRVTVVKAPTVGGVNDLRPGLTNTASVTTANASSGAGGSTAGATPGFGALLAALALLAAVAVARTRR